MEEEFIVIPISDLPEITDVDNFVSMEPPKGFATIRISLEHYYHRMALVYLAREREAKRRKQAKIDEIRAHYIASNSPGQNVPAYEDLSPLAKELIDRLVENHTDQLERPWKYDIKQRGRR